MKEIFESLGQYDSATREITRRESTILNWDMNQLLKYMEILEAQMSENDEAGQIILKFMRQIAWKHVCKSELPDE